MHPFADGNRHNNLPMASFGITQTAIPPVRSALDTYIAALALITHQTKIATVISTSTTAVAHRKGLVFLRLTPWTSPMSYILSLYRHMTHIKAFAPHMIRLKGSSVHGEPHPSICPELPQCKGTSTPEGNCAIAMRHTRNGAATASSQNNHDSSALCLTLRPF